MIACWWLMRPEPSFRLGWSAPHTGRIFHLGFLPSDFYYRRDEQFATLVSALERAATEARQERSSIRTAAYKQ
jgi:hypothetical protein